MAEKHPQANWLVGNRYFVGDVVGRGGYGMVCRGVDRKSGKQVALKMLAPEAGRDRDVVERMLREQQALVALQGTCAVTAIDLCRLESGAPCLVMEWLEGQDLEQQLSAWEGASERGSLEQLLDVVAPITDTLERAHAIGIVHRDIKPANIFLTREAPPGTRLLDFGLASMRSAAPLTEAGMVMGSPSYIAPETWRGNSTALDGRADLYSLSVIVFRWLTGKLPFDAPDLVGKMMAVTRGPRPSAVALRPELPSSVDAWVTRALAIEPKDRFQSGLELRDALAAALKGKPLPKAKAASFPRPKALADAQDAFASAFRSATALLKRFTTVQRSDPPPAQAAAQAKPQTEAGPAKRNTLWLDSNELQEEAPKRNTLWLDSNELQEEAPKRNTVWLDSEELQEAPKRNTLWLDSNELQELGQKPDHQATTRSSSTPPPPPNREAKKGAGPKSRPVSVAKAKLRPKASKIKPPKKAKARVSARKRRKGLARKSSR
jgi:serine/threonine-protein kinase